VPHTTPARIRLEALPGEASLKLIVAVTDCRSNWSSVTPLRVMLGGVWSMVHDFCALVLVVRLIDGDALEHVAGLAGDAAADEGGASSRRAVAATLTSLKLVVGLTSPL
jgi:hypothetical protein